MPAPARTPRLTGPPGWTPRQVRDVAVIIAGWTITDGGGAAELTERLQFTGLLRDPDVCGGRLSIVAPGGRRIATLADLARILETHTEEGE